MTQGQWSSMFQKPLSLNKARKRPLTSHRSNRRLFHLQDVSVEFGKIKALQHIQLDIEEGEIIFITGASGAGKTSLLKLLGGQLAPNSGKIETASGKFIAPVFQDLRFIENLSIIKNLEFSFDSRLYSSYKDFEEELMDYAKVLGIKERLHLKIADANGGLRQKVGFLRAMLSRPDVVIADEPTASLDYENARKIYDILNLYNVKRGLTVIWATHNKDLVKKFSGRMIHLDRGRLIYSGHACFI